MQMGEIYRNKAENVFLRFWCLGRAYHIPVFPLKLRCFQKKQEIFINYFIHY